MTDAKQANNLKQIILNSLKFNVVYLAAGVTVVALNLLNFYPQIINSDYAINTMYSTIIVPPTILMLTVQIINICLFYRIKGGELKQKQRLISKTTLTICKSVYFIIVILVSAALLGINLWLNLPIMGWLTSYTFVWMSISITMISL